MILGCRRNAVLTLDEVSEFMGISPASVAALMRAGELPTAVAADGQQGVMRNDLSEYLNAEGVLPAWTRPDAPRVLVADENVDVAVTVYCMLERAGIETTVLASAASEVKCRMDETPFEVVILNRMLNGASGEEVARWIRVERADWRVGLVMMSGASDFAAEYEQRHSRFADACLLKPFDIIDLMLCLLRLRPWQRLRQALEVDAVQWVSHVGSTGGAPREAASD